MARVLKGCKQLLSVDHETLIVRMWMDMSYCPDAADCNIDNSLMTCRLAVLTLSPMACPAAM